MMAHWQGHERIALWMGNPNVASAWLAMLAMLACGTLLAILGCRRLNKWRWLCGGILLCAVILLFLLAGFTYSRGGYVAILTGCTAAGVLQSWRCKTGWQRLSSLVPTVLFVGLLAFGVPAGVTRLAAVGDTRDLSIRNRLAVWRGAAMLTHEYPLRGVGERPGRLYTIFYQPLEKNESYNGMLGDFQTIASSHGLPLATGLLALLLLSFFWALTVWWHSRDPLLLWMAAAVGVFLLTGLFTTCHNDATIQWTLVALFLGTCSVAWWRGKAIRFFLWSCAVSLGMATAISFLTWKAGGVFHARFPYRITPGPLEAIRMTECLVKPNRPTGQDIVFIYERPVFAAQMDWEEFLRGIALPMAAHGHRVLVVPITADAFDEAALQQVILRERAMLEASEYALAVHGANVANLIIRAVRGIPTAACPQMIAVDALIPHHPFTERRIEGNAWEGPIFLMQENMIDTSEMEQLCKELPNIRFGTWQSIQTVRNRSENVR